MARIFAQPRALHLGQVPVRMSDDLVRIDHPARMAEQLPDRDPAPVGEQAGKPALNGVVETHPALTNELQDHRRSPHLADAPDTQPGVGTHWFPGLDVCEPG